MQIWPEFCDLSCGLASVSLVPIYFSRERLGRNDNDRVFKEGADPLEADCLRCLAVGQPWPFHPFTMMISGYFCHWFQECAIQIASHAKEALIISSAEKQCHDHIQTNPSLFTFMSVIKRCLHQTSTELSDCVCTFKLLDAVYSNHFTVPLFILVSRINLKIWLEIAMYQ